MLAVESNVRRDYACLDRRKAVLGLVELIVDLANPSETCRHDQAGSQRVVVCQQVPAAIRRLVLLGVQWVRRNNEVSRWRAVETVIAEAVPPHAVVNGLSVSQLLIDRKAPDVLDVRIDKGGE